MKRRNNGVAKHSVPAVRRFPFSWPHTPIKEFHHMEDLLIGIVDLNADTKL